MGCAPALGTEGRSAGNSTPTAPPPANPPTNTVTVRITRPGVPPLESLKLELGTAEGQIQYLFELMKRGDLDSINNLKVSKLALGTDTLLVFSPLQLQRMKAILAGPKAKYLRVMIENIAVREITDRGSGSLMVTAAFPDYRQAILLQASLPSYIGQIVLFGPEVSLTVFDVELQVSGNPSLLVGVSAAVGLRSLVERYVALFENSLVYLLDLP